jgi:hypothetical protein
MANWATWLNQTFAASAVRPSKPLGRVRSFDRRSSSPARQGKPFKTSGARRGSRQSESGRSRDAVSLEGATGEGLEGPARGERAREAQRGGSPHQP